MIPPAEAKLRAEALKVLGHATVRIYDYAMLDVMHDRIGSALWSVKRAEKHLRDARLALNAWKRLR